MAKKLTVRDIAKICNVSPTTVSRISNGIGNFSDETRRLVLNVMKEQGYPIKNNISEDERPLVGIVLYEYSNEYHMSIVSEITKQLEDEYTVVTMCSNFDYNRQQEILNWFEKKKASYVFLVTSLPPLPDPSAYSYNIIFLNYIPDEQYETKNGFHFVLPDTYVGGKLAAGELIRNKCIKPIILNNRINNNELIDTLINKKERIKGFIDEFAKNGITIDNDHIINADINKSSYTNGHDNVTYLCTKGFDFDSIFACNDWLAYGALVALETMNYKVPDQIKIVGFDGSKISTHCKPTITTVKLNGKLLGQTAVNIMKRIKNNEIDNSVTIIPTSLLSGRTT